MSTDFCVAMTPRRVLKFFPGKIDFPKVVSTIESQAAEWEAAVERRGDDLVVNFCPEGDLFFFLEEQAIRGAANCSIAGPGFHAAVVDFCNSLAAKTRLDAVCEEDPYAKSGDFDALAREVYLPYLNELLTAVEEQSKEGSEAICVAWPVDWYLLANAPENFWYCPTGMYPCSVKEDFDRDPMAFLRDFFIWPNRGRDAFYLRNLAMSLAWTVCSFQPDDPSCKKICKILEKALKEDPQVPFPKKLYLELCEICERTPVALDGVAEDTRFDTVGFRKYSLFAPVGNWDLLIPGGFRREVQKDGAILLEEPERQIRASSVVCQVSPEEEAEFCTKMLSVPLRQTPDKEFLETILTGKNFRAELFRVSEWKHPFLLECRKVEPGGNLLTVGFNFKTRSGYQWGLDILKTSHCREEE